MERACVGVLSIIDNLGYSIPSNCRSYAITSQVIAQMLYTEQKINLFHSVEILHENVKHENRNLRMATFLK